VILSFLITVPILVGGIHTKVNTDAESARRNLELDLIIWLLSTMRAADETPEELEAFQKQHQSFQDRMSCRRHALKGLKALKAIPEDSASSDPSVPSANQSIQTAQSESVHSKQSDNQSTSLQSLQSANQSVSLQSIQSAVQSIALSAISMSVNSSSSTAMVTVTDEDDEDQTFDDSTVIATIATTMTENPVQSCGDSILDDMMRQLVALPTSLWTQQTLPALKQPVVKFAPRKQVYLFRKKQAARPLHYTEQELETSMDEQCVDFNEPLEEIVGEAAGGDWYSDDDIIRMVEDYMVQEELIEDRQDGNGQGSDSEEHVHDETVVDRDSPVPDDGASDWETIGGSVMGDSLTAYSKKSICERIDAIIENHT